MQSSRQRRRQQVPSKPLPSNPHPTGHWHTNTNEHIIAADHGPNPNSNQANIIDMSNPSSPSTTTKPHEEEPLLHTFYVLTNSFPVSRSSEMCRHSATWIGRLLLDSKEAVPLRIGNGLAGKTNVWEHVLDGTLSRRHWEKGRRLIPKPKPGWNQKVDDCASCELGWEEKGDANIDSRLIRIKGWTILYVLLVTWMRTDLLSKRASTGNAAMGCRTFTFCSSHMRVAPFCGPYRPSLWALYPPLWKLARHNMSRLSRSMERMICSSSEIRWEHLKTSFLP